MTNPNNYADLTGRLVSDPTFEMSNNGKTATVFISLAVQDNFRTKGEYKAQFISLQKLVSTQSQIDYHKQFKKGDTVKAMCSVEINATENETFMNFVINSIYPLIKATPNDATKKQTNVASKNKSTENNKVLIADDDLPF